MNDYGVCYVVCDPANVYTYILTEYITLGHVMFLFCFFHTKRSLFMIK